MNGELPGAGSLPSAAAPASPSAANADRSHLNAEGIEGRDCQCSLQTLENELWGDSPPLVKRRLTVLRDPRPWYLLRVIELESGRLHARIRDSEHSSWHNDARTNLTHAVAALRRGDLEGGWTLVHQAHCAQVNAYTVCEVRSEAQYMRREASSGRFRPAQRDVICEQLDEVEWLLGPRASESQTKLAELAPKEVQKALVNALNVRDRCYANEYYELALTRRYQAILLLVALAIILAALVGSMITNPDFEDGITRGWTAVGAALSGALGGITSALQRTARRQSERLPEKIGSLGSALSRPVVGAVAGMTVFLAVRAGAMQASDQQVAYLFLVAFGAGFAERLVVRDPREESAEMMEAAQSVARPSTAQQRPDRDSE